MPRSPQPQPQPGINALVPDAIATIAAVMADPLAPPADRLRAALAILDRAAPAKGKGQGDAIADWHHAIEDWHQEDF
jgi:hypothetical protein